MNTLVILLCDRCQAAYSASSLVSTLLVRCWRCEWLGCEHAIKRNRQGKHECEPQTDNCRFHEEQRVEQKKIAELRAAGKCVTPSGRTDKHMVFSRVDDAGKLICAFCGKGAES